MLKKTITYTDYDENERTETFYFNLTKAELMDMELLTDGGMTNAIERMIEEQDVQRLITLFKDVIDKSYGVKTVDGKRFIKNQEVLDEFRQSEAYSELYMELVTNADAASEFINGIMPSDITKQASLEEVSEKYKVVKTGE